MLHQRNYLFDTPVYYYSHPEHHTFPIIIVKLQDHGVSGSDFRKTNLVSVSDFKRGSRRLGESRILPFYTPTAGNIRNYCV